MDRRKLIWRTGLPILFSAAACAVLISLVAGQGWTGRMLTQLAGMPAWTILLALACMAVNAVAASWRYHAILVGLRADRAVMRFRTILALNWFSLFVAYVLPLPFLADVTRAGYLRAMLRLPLRTAVASVVFDRVMALLGLVVFGLFGLPIQWRGGVALAALRGEGVIWAGACTAAALITIAAGLDRRLPESLRAATGVAVDFLTLFRDARGALVQAAAAALYICSFAGAVWAVAQGLGVAVGPLLVLACAPVIFLAQNIPIFWGGWGGREAAMVATLGSVAAIGAEHALAIAVAVGAVSTLVSLPGGLLLIFRPWLSTRGAMRNDGKQWHN